MDLQQFKQTHNDLFKIIAVILIIFIFVLTISVLVGISNKVKEGRYIGQDIESKHTITVNATGEVYVKPDLALVSFSVVTEAETAVKAMNQNTENMNAVIKFIKEQGVESKDLKTTSFNIYPRYEYRKVESLLYPYPPGKRILVGYEVTQQLQVKIRDLEKIGIIIEEAVNAGANQVGSLQFTIDNQDELKGQARKEAIDEAKDKAKELAKQLGVKLVRITNFSETSVLPQYRSLEMLDVPMGTGGGAPEIETGENKINVTVNISYEIN